MGRSFRQRILNINISRRIFLFFTGLLLMSLLFSGILYKRIYSSLMLDEVNKISMQNLRSISSNIRIILKNVNNSSKVILSNSGVQQLLNSENGYSELELKDGVNRTISSMMSNYDEILSIYVLDTKGHRYYADYDVKNVFLFNSSFHDKIWARARELRGESYFVQNGGEIFNGLTTKDFVSNIRIINDLTTQKPIGGVVINVSKDELKSSYNSIVKKDGTKIYLFDENASLILSSYDYSRDIKNFTLDNWNNNHGSYVDKKNSILYSYLNILEYNWRIVTVIPISDDSTIYTLTLTSLSLFFLLTILVLIGSVIIARVITKPINIMVNSMVDIGRGDLNELYFETSITEFNSLRDGYNLMTMEIKSLLKKIVIDEKRKRRTELETLQAQIKPHFLYNTFDSISSLALMGENKKVYKMVTSLGKFYRINLSKGREVISFKQEIEALKSYLNILSLRYDNFITNFYIEDETSNVKVLKLILQPFLENSIYHGIKPKGEPGIINIYGTIDSDFLSIKIEDNGIGMEEDIIKTIFSSKSSFGVRGTIERINLFYEGDDLVIIKSKKGVGTTVIIKIPLGERVLYGNL
ncbi:hypothetical protein EW093_09410 [Thiospirochaeta perfilievii]|uniref:histidine kinase n=1 Tax=Thiospirochaeta perfilievii TaxID=252967 RepID=A0A5C1QDW6_9SPIO|nr:sensor histidine kinase [Thiospirochaeta perfilievii]QEN04914.1 hypothetical protein EW093_09410 [Thiospirochaeta perfilievii]